MSDHRRNREPLVEPAKRVETTPTALSDARGVRLALDWGRARVGVAACDPDGTMAYPVETIANGPKPGHREQVLARLRVLVIEYEPVELVLGWPTSLAGTAGLAVEAMTAVEETLTSAFAPLRVVRVDERMSTAEASRKLAGAGRDSRQRRGVIDQAAAVGILDGALNARRLRRDRGERERLRTRTDEDGDS